MNCLEITPLFGFIDEFVRRWNQMPPARHNLVLVLVVFGFLLLGVAIWALFFHTPSSLRKSSRSSKKHQQEKRRRKWRKRRREHRPLNPTLAQTGGLPPARDPEAGPRPEAGP